MLPTPDTAQLPSSVYEPAEDTFCLLDALEADAEWIKSRKQTSIACEIGVGSGVVSTFIGLHLGHHIIFCTDVNEYACAAAVATANLNKCNALVLPVQTSLVGGLRCSSNNMIDLLVYNPPYVLSDDYSLEQGSIQSAAWAGGYEEQGLAQVAPLYPMLKHLLAPMGVFYLVLTASNQPEQIIAMLSRDWGMQGTIVLRRRAGRETLHVLRIVNSTTELAS